MVTIRKARRSDVKTLVSLWRAFRQYNQRLLSGNKAVAAYARTTPAAPRHFAAWARKQIGSRSGVICLAESDGKAVGYCLVCLRNLPPMSTIRRLAWIDHLFVLEEFRGQGISTKLKNKAFSWIQRKGIRYVTLFVLEENRMPQAIYKKWGFVPFVVEMRKNL